MRQKLHLFFVFRVLLYKIILKEGEKMICLLFNFFHVQPHAIYSKILEERKIHEMILYHLL